MERRYLDSTVEPVYRAFICRPSEVRSVSPVALVAMRSLDSCVGAVPVTAAVVLSAIWMAATLLLLVTVKHATRVPWWEQVLLDIDAAPATTEARERELIP